MQEQGYEISQENESFRETGGVDRCGGVLLSEREAGVSYQEGSSQSERMICKGSTLLSGDEGSRRDLHACNENDEIVAMKLATEGSISQSLVVDGRNEVAHKKKPRCPDEKRRQCVLMVITDYSVPYLVLRTLFADGKRHTTHKAHICQLEAKCKSGAQQDPGFSRR